MDVERSTDGKNWTLIHSVPSGAMNGNSVCKFSITISPHPVVAKQYVTIRFSSDKLQRILVQVISQLGAVVGSREIPCRLVTTIRMPEAANHPAGVYAVRVTSLETHQRVDVFAFMIR